MKMYYIGLDIHKKIIAYCMKDASGSIVEEGTIEANRKALKKWLDGIKEPWTGAMEATMFTGWVYDFLKHHTSDLKVANPQMLKAIAAAKKKNDKVDARMIADLLRCDLI
ncbi:MAG: transposase, partial [bacterium]|nr:transposase [bacterium]